MALEHGATSSTAGELYNSTGAAVSDNMRELQSNQSLYLAQLEQVNTALLAAPGNEEFVKLKSDLEELLAITDELLNFNNTTDFDSELSNAVMSEDRIVHENPNWTVNDKCQAPWSSDGKYFPAIIHTISADIGTCKVHFEFYDVIETVKIRDLKPSASESKSKRTVNKYDISVSNAKSNKQKAVELREYRKKKVQKKEQRRKDVDELSNLQQKRWQDFKRKSATSKFISSKLKSRSIFSVPDSIGGKVGVGTCNVGGKPMTAFEYPKSHK